MTADVKEDWSKRQMWYSFNDWQAVRGFTIAGAATETDALQALKTLTPPVQINGLHPQSNYLFCGEPKVTSKGPTFWEATATYSLGAKIDVTSPLLAPAKITWEVGETTDAVDIDVFGNAIKNSAGDPFTSPLSALFPTLFVSFEINMPLYDPAKNLLYQGKVNADNFSPLGFFQVEPGQCRCHGIFPSRSYTKLDIFVPVVYRFELRAGRKKDADGLWDGFKNRILDQGSMGWYIPPSGSTAQRGIFYDADKPPSRVSQDILLDGTGKPKIATFTCGNKSQGGQAPVSNPGTPVPSGVYMDNTGPGVFLKYQTFLTATFTGGIGL